MCGLHRPWTTSVSATTGRGPLTSARCWSATTVGARSLGGRIQEMVPLPARIPAYAVLFVAVLACLAIAAPSSADAANDLLQTLLDGVLFRRACLERVACECVVEETRGPTYRAYLDKEAARLAEELYRARLEEGGPEAAAKVAREFPPVGDHDALWASLRMDRPVRRWLLESVALTNSGQPNPGCRLDAMSPSGRAIPPGVFYCSTVCDGITVTKYDRSTQEGFVSPFENEYVLERWYGIVRHGLLGTTDHPIDRWQAGTAQVRYEGTTRTGAWGDCHGVFIGAPAASGGAARLLICPSYGYAVVQRTSWSQVPLDDRPPLYVGFVAYGTDFFEVRPGVWCPRTARLDQFSLQIAPASASWERSSVCRVLDLRVGDEADLDTPRVFPFGTRVETRGGAGKRTVVPLVLPVPAGPATPPDPTTMESLWREAKVMAE